MEVVTGAFGYTGKYITRRLLDMGVKVKTLTGHPDRHDPFEGAVTAEPFNFDRPAELAKQLSGVSTLYNTYWIRFDRGQVTFDSAVENIKTLIHAAQQAGVERLVHVSITNPSSMSPLPYFRGKGLVEEAITGFQVFLRHSQAYGGVRRGGCPDKQHRLVAAEIPGFHCSR